MGRSAERAAARQGRFKDVQKVLTFTRRISPGARHTWRKAQRVDDTVGGSHRWAAGNMSQRPVVTVLGGTVLVVMPPNTPAERGRRLEQHIASYFAAYGYAVQTNQVLRGRSGGRHEIDVLAEKSDPLTTVRIAVECKAWSSPIEKDVVSKLHYVMTDLGIHKGVVVSLAGMRAGAHTAAAELGIDVWGPDELRHHLGDSVFADVAMASPPAHGSGRLAYAWPFRVDSGAAEHLIRNKGKGRFGLRTLEAMAWFAPLWIPAYLLQLTVAQRQTGRLRQHLASTVITNLYDALGGEFITAANTPPRLNLPSATPPRSRRCAVPPKSTPHYAKPSTLVNA